MSLILFNPVLEGPADTAWFEAMQNSITGPIRVVLVDHHTVVRAAVRMLLESRPGLQVVAEAANRDEALSLIEKVQPDVILLGLDLSGESGLSFLWDFFSVAPDARVIVFTGVTDPEAHRQAVRFGAMGVVTKDQTPEMLVSAIERVHAGEVWLNPSLVAGMLNELSGRRDADKGNPEAARIATLSERECEVIKVICLGLSNKEIAHRLSISEMTVGQHLRSIYAKLGLRSRLELVIYAFRNRLGEPPR